MDREYLAKLCEARDVLCDFCDVEECERCIVTHLINDAYNEMPDEDGELNLPNEAVIEISELNCCLNNEDEIMNAAVEFLSDELGFCIRNCDISLENEGLAEITNIEWDTDE